MSSLSRARGASAFVALVVLLVGCPKRAPESSGATLQDGSRRNVPTLAEGFEALRSDLYLLLRDPPPGGVLLSALEEVHDVDRYTATPTIWGTNRVIEFSDTNRPESARSAVAGWMLGPRDDQGRETVESVLLRGFDGAPTAPSFQELLIGLQPGWELPWEICAPADSAGAWGGVDLVAHKSALGLKLGLSKSGPAEHEVWTVDHVEYFSTRIQLPEWWVSKGYGSCVPVGSLSAKARFSAAKQGM